MLFNSVEFAVFFLLVFGGYSLLKSRWYASKILLLISSYLFYMAWSPPFVLLLVFSTLLDFYAAQAIASAPTRFRRNAWLILSCTGNLGVLAFFKYGGFVTENVDWAVGTSFHELPLFQHLILPVGISFYTFQSMSYTIDVYRNGNAVCRNFVDFALYVSFFPQLVAGPIIRSQNFLPQLGTRPEVSADDALRAFDLIFRGLFKKVFIADTLAVYVDLVFSHPADYGTVNQLVAIYSFAIQIYCDFSGYSDIAIGIALLLGFRIPVNFNLPYLATGPSDFWRRWHISLSTWLRDYLYISLGGNRSSRWKTYRNLIITMVLGGLWHGAGWGFIVWGIFHGVWLAIHRALFRDSDWMRIPRFIAVPVTFHLVCFGWIFFRAPTLGDALTIMHNIFNTSAPVYMIDIKVIVFLILGIAAHVLGAATPLKSWWGNAFFGWRILFYAAVLMMLFFNVAPPTPFIYFQF
jgi:alginate O-acetyltransferase complex protein AlgI